MTYDELPYDDHLGACDGCPVCCDGCAADRAGIHRKGCCRGSAPRRREEPPAHRPPKAKRRPRQPQHRRPSVRRDQPGLWDP